MTDEQNSISDAELTDVLWPAGMAGQQAMEQLRRLADAGSRDAIDQLVELAGERGDFAELRRLADGGSTDAADQLVELAGERGDLDELRRLAEGGNSDAADILTELAGELADELAEEHDNCDLD